uniref:Uncharacterized protein n=1 Tax=viral metagenome TaxID=1070528 RepID=A0A6H1ZZN4_9ZZZZ
MPRGTPDFWKPKTLDKGFRFIEYKDVDYSFTAIAGSISRFTFAVPDIGHFYELLSAFVYATETPAAVPEVTVESRIAELPQRGYARALTLGVSRNVYEFVISAERVFAFKTAKISQSLVITMEANAAADTTFYLQVLIGVYSLL